MKQKFLVIALFLFAAYSVTLAQVEQKYYSSKIINLKFEDASKKIETVFKSYGFGVITEIDMDVKLKEKLEDVDIKPYRILGICNPSYAYETLKVEENIGLFLPCKVLVKYIDENSTEVIVVNPTALMKLLGNKELIGIAEKVNMKFEKALREI